MPPTLLIQIIQGLVPFLVQGFAWVTQTTTALKQSAEMTPAEEKALDDSIAGLKPVAGQVKTLQQQYWTPDDGT